ncbi:MAG: hypothetical protein LBI20_02490, partial [Holosporales bacterium]|nr:hypothetical protein [Holosporales bacterium]
MTFVEEELGPTHQHPSFVRNFLAFTSSALEASDVRPLALTIAQARDVVVVADQVLGRKKSDWRPSARLITAFFKIRERAVPWLEPNADRSAFVSSFLQEATQSDSIQLMGLMRALSRLGYMILSSFKGEDAVDIAEAAKQLLQTRHADSAAYARATREASILDLPFRWSASPALAPQQTLREVRQILAKEIRALRSSKVVEKSLRSRYRSIAWQLLGEIGEELGRDYESILGDENFRRYLIRFIEAGMYDLPREGRRQQEQLSNIKERVSGIVMQTQDQVQAMMQSARKSNVHISPMWALYHMSGGSALPATSTVLPELRFPNKELVHIGAFGNPETVQAGMARDGRYELTDREALVSLKRFARARRANELSSDDSATGAERRPPVRKAQPPRPPEPPRPPQRVEAPAGDWRA